MTTELLFEQLSVRGVRNLQPADLRFAPTLNLIVGGNGYGKTSLLEALSLATTCRSFRTEQVREVVKQGAEFLVASVSVVEDGLSRQQRVVINEQGRQGFIDGKRIPGLARFAARTPIVVFSPSDLQLVTGSATTRRNLLDRIALYSDPSSQEHRLAYARALRHRQLLLEQAGTDSRALLAFESVMAQEGHKYACAHAAAAETLIPFLKETFGSLSSSQISHEANFVGVDAHDPEVFAQTLFEKRTIDRQRGRASFGPHRDELELVLAGRTARHHASQGQQRLLALAIKLAELRCIEALRELHPILLLDDVSSELDRSRTSRVFEWLQLSTSQIFLTTPRLDLLDTPAISAKDPATFIVENGDIRRSG